MHFFLQDDLSSAKPEAPETEEIDKKASNESEASVVKMEENDDENDSDRLTPTTMTRDENPSVDILGLNVAGNFDKRPLRCKIDL
jgi:hypothetical protein